MKSSKKMKAFSSRLLALMLCCVCLVGVLPVAAFAMDADTTPVVEDIIPEQPKEGDTFAPENDGALVPVPSSLTNPDDSSLGLGGNELKTKSVPTTEPTTVPTTEPTTVPTTEPTTVPTTEPTTEPTTKLTSTSPNTQTKNIVLAEEGSGETTNPNARTITGPNGETSEITLLEGETAKLTSDVDSDANNFHRESWTSSNPSVATVEGIFEGYKAPSATITGVSEGRATITHTYYTRSGYSWTSHTETIEVSVSAPEEYSVSFNVGDAPVDTPSAKTVREGQTVSELPELVWKDEAGQDVKRFDGWYDASGNKFTTETKVTADITLTAKWIDIYTVSFNVGAAPVDTPDSVRVEDGQTVSEWPADPVWKDETGEYVMVFAGWYSDEALTKEFTTTTTVTADTILYAKWLDPGEDGIYYVNFYSQDGLTKHLTLSALQGKTVQTDLKPTLQDKTFIGWATEKQGEATKTFEELKFSFSTPISSVATDGTLNLYAWYVDSVTVSFDTNGGDAIPPQTVAGGGTATKPTNPTRTGYTFRGWSTDKDNYTAFDFAEPLYADTTLYAFWDANMVPVTIVYMYENANDDDYSPAGDSDVVYAPAGSYISVEKNTNITNKNATHAVRYADTENGAFTGNAKQTANANGTNATIPDIPNPDYYFQYETATNNRLVNPDGTTTVLVYYNRARVTLTFEYDTDRTEGSIDYTNLISAANREKYKVTYTQSSSNPYDFTYSFTAKYEEDITAVWPQVAWVKSPDGNTAHYENSYFMGWKKPNTNTQVTNMYTLEWDLFGSSKGGGLSINSEGKLVGGYTLPDVFNNVEQRWAIYARTTLPGESVDFVYRGKNYTIYMEACQMFMASEDLGYKQLNGCTPISGNHELSTTYSRNMSISYGYNNNLTTNSGSSIKAKFDTVFADEVKSGELNRGDNCQVLLYDRNNLTLQVWTNDETYSASQPQTKEYLYGDKIYNDDNDLLKTLESTMKKEGYRFAGWYTTSEFTPGTEYKPDENSTITANMDLFAKWEPDQYLAEYYLYRDDTDPYAEQGFAEGDKIENKFVPFAVKDNFLGWYWYQDGQLVPFDFTQPVGKNYVDENGVLKLYAMWKDAKGIVSYLPGIGGDNANQEEYDKTSYDINKAAVQLPTPTKVWGGAVPTDSKLTFVGWKAPNGVIYQPGRYVYVTRNHMQFEAQWSEDAVKLIYHANGGQGDDVTENWARGSNVSIWDNNGNTPHFTWENHTLLGWSTDPKATTPDYELGKGSITLTANETNLYAIWKLDLVKLTIKKTVSGNMYNANDVFNFTLTYVGKEDGPVEFHLQANGTVKFFIPVGANVTVTEIISNNGYVPSNGTGTTVTLDSVIKNDGIFNFTMPDENGTLVINNDKNVQVDTGILLDTLPYILILGVVAAGAVLMIKKRRNRDDY